jgi:hypothetical protein
VGGPPSVEFAAKENPEALGPTQVVVRGARGRIALTGTFLTGCAGVRAEDLRTAVQRTGNELTFCVVDPRANEECAYMIVPFSYRAVIGNLPPGTFHLTVDQVTGVGRTVRRVWEGQVRVR